MDKWELEEKLAKYFDSKKSFKDCRFIIVLILHTGKTLFLRRDERLVAHWQASSQGEVGAVGGAGCRLGGLYLSGRVRDEWPTAHYSLSDGGE